jgi:hypothetical protein
LIVLEAESRIDTYERGEGEIRALALREAFLQWSFVLTLKKNSFISQAIPVVAFFPLCIPHELVASFLYGDAMQAA